MRLLSQMLVNQASDELPVCSDGMTAASDSKAICGNDSS